MADDKPANLQCRSEPCKYHGHLLLDEWCRHPAHLVELDADRQAQVMTAGGRCKDFVHHEMKVMPGEELKWPMPVVVQHLIAVIALSVRHAYKNDKKSAKNDTTAA